MIRNTEDGQLVLTINSEDSVSCCEIFPAIFALFRFLKEKKNRVGKSSSESEDPAAMFIVNIRSGS